MLQDKSCFQRILTGWYGKPKQVWRLVYRASSHGSSADSFHRHCDGVAPTFVIITVQMLIHILIHIMLALLCYLVWRS